MATLPSISSLLQLAGSNTSALSASNKSIDLAAVKANVDHSFEQDQDVPKPLTNDLVRQATSELPNGTAQALHSCLNAFKMKRLSAQEFIAFVRSIAPQSKTLSTVFPETQVTMGDKLSMPLGPLVLAAPASLPGLDASFNANPSILNLPFQLSGHNSPLLAAGIKRGMEGEHCESPKFSKTGGVKEESGRTQTAGAAPGESSTGERHACAVQALMDLMSHDPSPAAPAGLTLPPPSMPANARPSDVGPADPGRLAALASPPALALPSMLSKPAALVVSSPSAHSPPAAPHGSSARDFPGPQEAAAGSPPQTQSLAEVSPDKVDSPGAASLASMLDRAKLGPTASGGSGEAPSPTSPPASTSGAANSDDGSAHNKYCHFCQHIKVKRASSMLACENRGCNRRFCEHCLTTHLNDPRSSQEWRRKGGAWHCPICTKSCCCTMRECSKAHRHCKAYRYRRKRAQQAELDKLTPDPADPMAFFRPPPFHPAHMPPPHLHFMPYPGFACPPPPHHHPVLHPQAFHLARR